MSMFSWSCNSEVKSSGDENNVGEVKHLVKSKVCLGVPEDLCDLTEKLR